MDNLEKQLNNISQQKLSSKTDFKIRKKIYSKIWKKNTQSIFIFTPRVLLSGRNPALLKRSAYALLILIIVSGVPGYAYASNNVTQGHVLYPIKKSIEKIEVGLAFSEEAKAKKYSKFVDRRIEESFVMMKKNQTNNNDNLKRTIDNLSATDKKIDQIVEKNKIKLIDKKEEQVSLLKEIATKVGVDVSECVMNSVALAIEELENESEKEQEVLTNNKNIFIPKVETVEIKIPERRMIGNDVDRQKQVIVDLKIDVAELKENLENKMQYRGEDVSKIIGRLDSKIENVERVMKENRNGSVTGLLKSTQAVIKNAKHFLRVDNQQVDKVKVNNSASIKDEVKKEEGNKKSNGNSIKKGNSKK